LLVYFSRVCAFPLSAERRSVMKVLLIVAAALALLTVPLQARAYQIEQVTLRIEGVHTDEDGVAIMDALAQVPNIKVATRPTAQNPTVILVALEGAKYDLGDLARTVAGTKTPNRLKGAPSAALVLTYKARDGEAAASRARDLKTICAKLEGVDAKKCQLDTQKKEFQIKLDDKGGAKLADIKKALPGLDTEYYPKR
jgi:hypothetical protein